MRNKFSCLIVAFPTILSCCNCNVSQKIDSFLVHDKNVIIQLNNFSCFYKKANPGENRKNVFKSLYTGKDYFFNGAFYDQIGSDKLYKPISVEFGQSIEKFYVCYIPDQYKLSCLNYLLTKQDPNLEDISKNDYSFEEFIDGFIYYASKKLNYLQKCKWYCLNTLNQMQMFLPYKNNISLVLASKNLTIKKDFLSNQEVNKNCSILGRKVLDKNTLILSENIYSGSPDSIYAEEEKVFELNGSYIITSDIKESYTLTTVYSPSIYTENHIPFALKKNSDSTYSLDEKTKEFIFDEYPKIYEQYLNETTDGISENTMCEILNKMRD